MLIKFKKKHIYFTKKEGVCSLSPLCPYQEVYIVGQFYVNSITSDQNLFLTNLMIVAYNVYITRENVVVLQEVHLLGDLSLQLVCWPTAVLHLKDASMKEHETYPVQESCIICYPPHKCKFLDSIIGFIIWILTS